MTAEQEAFERGFIAGFKEGKNQYQPIPYTPSYPVPGIVWSDSSDVGKVSYNAD